MCHAGVAGPVIREFPDESDGVGDFEASNILREVGKEGERQNHFVVGVVVAEGDVVHLLKAVEDELMASVLSGVDAVLVGEAGGLLFQVELLPRGTNKKPVMSRLRRQRKNSLTY